MVGKKGKISIVFALFYSLFFAMHVTIETSKWPINLELYEDKAPMTVANFINLAMQEYYNDLIFHRVIENFMIQWGCPHGTGTWGPGYQFADEFHEDLRHDGPGVLSMANSGPHTNGSQFFITHVETPWLDDRHTVFGRVKSDEDQRVVNSIEQGDKIERVTFEGDTAALFETVAEFLDAANTALGEQN